MMVLVELPFAVGVLMAISVVWILGFGIYGAGRWVLGRRIDAEPGTDQTNRLTENVFRISGTLLALILSLTFTDLRSDHMALRDAIELEAAEILDISADLGFFGTEAAADLRGLLLRYTRRVIDEEWQSLTQGELDADAVAAFNDLQFGMHALEALSPSQQSLRANLIQDVDEISDHRQHRAFSATLDPPQFIYVGLIGFLITVTTFIVYRATPVRVVMMSLYCVFIGIVLYAMLALSSPFYGPMKLLPQPFEVYSQIEAH